MSPATAGIAATTASATVVLVHGAWSGAWSWWKLTPLLSEREIPFVAVDLPTSSAGDTSLDVRDDAKHVRATTDAIDGPVVLVANSYGGVVISSADCAAPNVTRLVYVAAQMPAAGEPILQLLNECATDAFREAVTILPDGRLALDVETTIRDAYCQASPEDHDVVRANLSEAMSYGTDLNLAYDDVSWNHVPATFVVCADDRATQPAFERRWAAERAKEAIEWPTDHCPQVSHPQRVADLLGQLTAG